VAVLAEALQKSRPGSQLTRQEIERCLDPEYFVTVRTVTGGPAPEQTSAALARANAEQKVMDAWIASTEASLDEARVTVMRNS